MNYGYIRVSTDKQTVENQRYEIAKFAKQRDIQINGWIEETVSGTKAPDKRKLGELLKEVKFGDIIICSEISRLGRSLYMIMDILSICMDKGVTIMTIKDNLCFMMTFKPKFWLLRSVCLLKLSEILSLNALKRLSKSRRRMVSNLADPKALLVKTLNCLPMKMSFALLLLRIILMQK